MWHFWNNLGSTGGDSLASSEIPCLESHLQCQIAYKLTPWYSQGLQGEVDLSVAW